MNLDNLTNDLKNIIVLCGNNINITDINEQTNLVSDFAFSSIDLIQLVIKVETTFNFEFEDEDLTMEKLSSFSNLLYVVFKSINKTSKHSKEIIGGTK